MTAQLTAALERVLDPAGKVSGAGYLVADRYVLTCAHVVADTLRIPQDSPEPPAAEVTLDFPLVAPGRTLTGRVVCGLPVRPDGSAPADSRQSAVGSQPASGATQKPTVED